MTIDCPSSHAFRLRREVIRPFALAIALSLVAAVLSFTSRLALAVGSLANVEIIDRHDGRTLPVYFRDGTQWVEGTPGHEYTIRIRSHANGRLLAVTSVDGVNVVTGETASPSQSGYVLDPYGSTEIGGWRKSLGNTASFYFTDLSNAYATRTGRPDNVGVIGVAVFRERTDRIALGRSGGKIASQAERDSQAPSAAAPADAAPRSENRADSASDYRDSMRERALAPQLGTGHGRIEVSRAERVNFERDSVSPVETISIRYDRRENLIAMGIVLSPMYARRPDRPDPFPGLRFTPDPPPRWEPPRWDPLPRWPDPLPR